MSEFNERTRLLPGEPLSPTSVQPADRLSLFRETTSLAKATAPISASFALQNIVQALSVVTAGSLGSDHLDITSYGFMFATCTGSMVSIGGATALDTLCSQAVTSVKTQNNPTVLGRHLQQSLFVLSALFLVIITPIWIFSGHLFVALGQEEDFARGTGRFLLFMIPAGYFQIWAECLKKYGQVQGQSDAVGWIVGVAAAVGVVANILLIKITGFGAYGAPAAFLIYQLATVGLLIILLWRRESEKKTVKMIRTWEELCDGLGTNIFLGMTGILTIATEWWR